MFECRGFFLLNFRIFPLTFHEKHPFLKQQKNTLTNFPKYYKAIAENILFHLLLTKKQKLMKLPKGFSSKYLSQKNATELLLTAAKKWDIELNDNTAQDVCLKFNRNLKFFNNSNIYPMWIMHGLKSNVTLDRIDEVILYCDMESGLYYYTRINDCTIFSIPQSIVIKGVKLEKKLKTNTLIYAPHKN